MLLFYTNSCHLKGRENLFEIEKNSCKSICTNEKTINLKIRLIHSKKRMLVFLTWY